MYIYHNKKTDDYYLFGSQPTLAKKTGIPIDTLKHKFSRKKTKIKGYKWEELDFTIAKVDVTKK